MKIEKVMHSGVDPLNFERPLSEAYGYSRRWNRDLPTFLHLRVDLFPALTRTLNPKVLEDASLAILKGLCRRPDVGRFPAVPAELKHRKYDAIFWRAANLCDVALERKIVKIAASERVNQTGSVVLAELDAMLQERNESDFLHRPTDYSHGLTRRLIETAYSHYVANAPIPAVAPDGEGGIIAEWKTDRRIVRLVVAATEEKRGYIYTRGTTRSQVDYSLSGLLLSQQLCSVFRD